MRASWPRGGLSIGAAMAAVALLGGSACAVPARALTAANHAQAHGAALPAWFANLVQFSGFYPNGNGWGILEVRNSADGKLAAQDAQTAAANGLAAYGNGRDLIIGLPAGQACATQLYRLKLSLRGRPGTLAPLGRKLPGALGSLAVSANGLVIGYAIRGCAKGQPGYLGILHIRNGRTKQWSGLNIDGISRGSVAITGELSMSANGGLLAFAGANVAASGLNTSQVVRVLRASAPPGTVAHRSRVVIRKPVDSPALADVSLTRDGALFYLCSVRAAHGHRISTVTVHGTLTGRQRGTVAVLTAPGPSYPQLALGCPMALDTTGAFLLVPYGIRYPPTLAGHPVMHAGRIRLGTRTAKLLSFILPNNPGGMDEAVSVRIAW